MKANGQQMSTGQKIEICIGSSVLYENISVNTSFINWKFQNGSPATSQSFSTERVTYAAAGLDTTTLTVIRGKDTVSMYILVQVNSVKPKAGFTFAPNNECGNIPVVFNSNTSTGNQLQYAWDFGDGNSSKVNNPTYAFIKAVGTTGTVTYPVKLVVRNDQNCYDSVTQQVTVKKIPDASIDNARSGVTFGPFNGEETFRRCANVPYYDFQFSNKSTTTTVNTQYTIQWGEGSPDSVFTNWPPGTIITHIFPIGKSVMTVSVLGNTGCIGTKTYIVFLGTTPAGSLGNIGENSICSPNSLTFPLHDFSTNPVGTTYSFFVNDGSPATLYQQAPDSITHFFNSGSCENYSGNYTNAFAATLFIENPCGSSNSQIVPLYVSGRPRANLDIYPSYNICTNSIATLSNASNFGGQITPTGGTSSTCTNEGKQVWEITPATGFTKISGTFGSLNGNRTNSTTWTEGSKLVDLNFTTPGTWFVKVYAGNDRCGINLFTKTICVREPPAASFIAEKKSGCAPNSVTFTNTSPAATCQGDNYRWDVTYNDVQNCGNATGYSFIKGTGITSKDAVLKFSSAGRYIIKLTVSDKANSFTCAPSVFQDTVFIKAKPKVILNPLGAICVGNTISPAVSANSCYSSNPATYAWTFAGGDPLTSDQAAPGNILYNATGNFPVTLAVTNDCGVTTVSDTARITSKPVANAGTDRIVCSGESVVIGSSPSPGISYKWAPVNGLSSSLAANPTATLFYNGPNGDTTFIFALTSAAGVNCSANDTIKIKVKKNPVVTVNPINTSVCAGTGTTLIASGAISYIWNPSSGLNANNRDTVLATPVGTTSYIVTGTSNGCSASATANIAVIQYVTVKAAPDTTVCNKSNSIQLSGSPQNGTWNGPFISTSGVFNASAANTGNFKVYYTAGPGVCTSTDSTNITVIKTPVARAGNDTTICQSNTAVQLTGLPAGGKWSNSSLVTSAGSFTPANPGTYTLIYTVGGGSCIAFDTVDITVGGAITNNTISGNRQICTGTLPGTITGQVATGGSGVSTYQWQSSADSLNWSNVANGTARDFAPGILTQTTWFRRIASTNLCQGPEASYSLPVKITVNQNATAQFNPTVSRGCVPFTLTPPIINLVPDNNTVGEYRWYVNDNYIGSGSNFPGFIMNFPADSATVKLVAVSRFGCLNDTTEHGFTTVERPVPSFTQSNTTGCGPLTVTFTNTTPNASSYNYQWNFGQGQTSNLEQPIQVVFPIHPDFGDTTYVVTMKTISSCDTLLTTHSVTVRAHPKALFAPDKTEGCSPMTIHFTNTSRGSNAGYTWDFGDGTPLSSSSATTIAHTFTTAVRDTFYVKLKGSNDCGSNSLVYAIVVNPNSIRIDFAVNGNERFGCAPHTVHFINNTQGANQFKWDFGDGDTLFTTRNIDTVSHNYTTAGDFPVVLYAANGCNDTTDTEMITVQTKPVVGFTANPIVACVTDTIRFTNTSDAGISYQWTFGDGTSTVVRDPAKSYSSPGNYRVQLTGSRIFPRGLSCSDSAFASLQIRDTLPGVFTVSDSLGSCTPFSVRFQNSTASSQTTWSFGDGSTATGQSASHTYTLPGEYEVIMISKSMGGCLYKAIHTIKVQAPLGTLSYSGGFTCTGNDVRFEVQATGTTTYSFVFGDGDSLVTSTPVIDHKYNIPGRFVPYVVLSNGSCRLKTSTDDTIKVDKVVAGYSLSAQSGCGATTLQFTDTSYAYFGITMRHWNFGDGTLSTATNPAKKYLQDVTNFVELAVSSASGCTDTISSPVNVHVRNKPVSTIVGDTIACTGQPLSLTALSISADSLAAFSWNFGNGLLDSGVHVSPVYNAAGSFTTRLISTTIFGCADTVFKKIKVSPSPVVSAGPDVRICLGQAVTLHATGTGSWQWSPVNRLSCIACANPLARPVSTTTYVATGTNSFGCSVADSVLVEVVQPLHLSVSKDDTICIGQQTQLFASGATNYLWSPASGLSSTTASNPLANPIVTTPYRVEASDAFNCFSDTGYVTVVVGPYPTVSLGSGTLVVAGTTVPFNPVLTNGPFSRYTWTPADNLSCTRCPTPVATINTNIQYRLEVENIYGCTASDTISFQVKCEDALQVFIPNSFSPDGDQVNDVFMVRGRGVAMVKYFRIFNRWGEVVFERNNFNANDPKNGWDGKVRGVRANPDVYVYTAEIICTAGGTFVRKGNVTLFR